jgi:predicted  nucleic acid-binding Zn-ribbon protein
MNKLHVEKNNEDYLKEYLPLYNTIHGSNPTENEIKWLKIPSQGNKYMALSIERFKNQIKKNKFPKIETKLEAMNDRLINEKNTAGRIFRTVEINKYRSAFDTLKNNTNMTEKN